MQIKKEEIKDTIRLAAQREFLLHGYEGASLRVIARKANTTLGNIYHYYKNKEELLGDIVEEPLSSLEDIMQEHLKEEVRVHSVEELERKLDEFDDILEETDLRYLMDERLVILMDLRTTRYVERRDLLLKEIKGHLAWHWNLKDSDSVCIDIVTTMLVSCVRHVLVEHKDEENVKEEFLKVFRMLCSGLISGSREEL